MERLLRAHGDDPPLRAWGAIYYHLIPREPFLARLEQENPEALSVIEGLTLPESVLLLPMPPDQTLRTTAQRTLLRDYWARRFEGELARAWPGGRGDDRGDDRDPDPGGDRDRFGPAALAGLIGPAGLAEAQDILTRGGVPGAAAGPAGLCRAFVARVLRLRYFAPGTRGCHFPAVPQWAALDRWLAQSGLDLPPPLSGDRLPLLLERSRPANAGGMPTWRFPLPAELPYGRDDPDRRGLEAAVALRAQGQNGAAGDLPIPGPVLDPAPGPSGPAPADPGQTSPPPADRLEGRCLAALRQGATIRRRPAWRAGLPERLPDPLRPLLRRLLGLWDRLPARGGSAERGPRAWVLHARLYLLRSDFAAAQRAELDGRHGSALGHLHRTRDQYERLREDHPARDRPVRYGPTPNRPLENRPLEIRPLEIRPAPAGPGPDPAPDLDPPPEPPPDPAPAWDSPVLALLDQRQRLATESLANALALAGRLPAAQAAGLRETIGRLGAERGPAARTARVLLRNLEGGLLAGDATYVRYDLRAWLATGRARQVLPFQGTLKALRALDNARRRLEDLPWPIADLDRLAAPLGALAARLGERLERHIRPHLQGALAAAGFVPGADADPAPNRPRTPRPASRPLSQAGSQAGPRPVPATDPLPERIALRRLADTLSELIRHRWELKFSDVRDLLARDALHLPDTTWSEVLRGDRLSRFDRAAALALPGVYRRGELYVKGLQRLGAPLFGTPQGRTLLRLALGPWLAAYLGLVGLELIWGLFAPGPGGPTLTGPAVVLPLALVLSLVGGTRLGRRTALALWRALADTARFVFGPGLGQVLRRARRRVRRWGPAAWLLERRLVRGLLDRLVAPLVLGMVPLLPVLALVWLLPPGHHDWTAWAALLALAFALGTLLGDTPGGRRWLDDLATAWRDFWGRLRHERLADLVALTMGFFKAQTRRLGDALHRVRTLLDRRLDEPWPGALLKSAAAPAWGALEALIQFYVVVLIEPQTNPVKHFPVVTLGHKLLLPFLPSISIAFAALLSPVLPAAIALPLVAITVFLIPGLFGFLFWELKENWKLYAANRGTQVPPARLGPHGETLRVLLRRGLPRGTLPKAFDRLREVLEVQARAGAADPRGLRRAARQLAEIEDMLARFAEQELILPLREGCGEGDGGLAAVAQDRPRLATQELELGLRLFPASGGAPLGLRLVLAMDDSGLLCVARADRPPPGLGDPCRSRIAESVAWFARRCGAEPPTIAWGPAAAASGD